ncbi:MAG: hypothetical protein ACAH21_13875 [Ramlibacter sp.]|nr:hypothetical protein [Ramlibacter sp.]
MGKKAIWISAAAALAAAAALGSAPAAAYTSVGVQIGFPAQVYVAPRPVPVYYPPPVQPSGVWVEGHWEWQGNGHAWVPGHYARSHTGYYQARNDRDHDGIPNRFDRDRDGDGVANRYDRSPDNPRRR